MNSTGTDNPFGKASSGRCGMCGACGSMPPWAPEMLKDKSPEYRRALERRMKEAQRRFIEERDAKMKAREAAQQHPSQTQPADSSSDSLREDRIQLSPNLQKELPNGPYPTQKTEYRAEGEQNVEPSPEKTQEKPAEPAGAQLTQHVISTEFPTEQHPEANTERNLDPPTNSSPPGAEIREEDDGDHDIPLDPMGIPPLPPSHNKETSSLNPDEYNLLQPPRRTQPQFSSPALQESPAQPETPELQALSDISLAPNQFSEPLRTISLRDADSDADSFHTAEGEEILQRSSDGLALKDDEETKKEIAPIISEVEWEEFQDGNIDLEPIVSVPGVSESAVLESATDSTDEDVSLEGHTRDSTHSESSSPKAGSVASQPTESLEDPVIIARTTTREPSLPQTQRDTLIDDYALPTDLVRPNELDLEPQKCEDCERWRERVQELELKVEALTSALNAREMENASMRARVGDRRYHGKNEAQLIQECESLRITTEYLYYKLERYEKKLNGSHPEIH